MNWENFLITALIALLTVPLTTLISLWLKWKWENPKIKGYFCFEDKSVTKAKYPNMIGKRVETHKSHKRYKLKDMIFAGRQELDELGFCAYRINSKNMCLFINIEDVKKDNIPKRIKQIIGHKD